MCKYSTKSTTIRVDVVNPSVACVCMCGLTLMWCGGTTHYSTLVTRNTALTLRGGGGAPVYQRLCPRRRVAGGASERTLGAVPGRRSERCSGRRQHRLARRTNQSPLLLACCRRHLCSAPARSPATPAQTPAKLRPSLLPAAAAAAGHCARLWIRSPPVPDRPHTTSYPPFHRPCR